MNILYFYSCFLVGEEEGGGGSREQQERVSR